MKRYRVWLTNMCAADIEAKKVEMVSLSPNDNRPIKIRFLGDNNYILAEFYCDMINGWAELKCIVDQ